MEENRKSAQMPEKTGNRSVRERLKSPAVWAAILGALTVVLNAFGLFEKAGIDSTEFDAIVNSVGSILIAFGILNNPTDPANF